MKIRVYAALAQTNGAAHQMVSRGTLKMHLALHAGAELTAHA